ncbi:hypothetical protein AB0K18_38270 [Nonomuraea sp. NPDC049421]|uniref:hypothetical protein n=1 Tax=Nonomuraea sp. NPDC049421 TaxID=3155275 RepID=UPI0034315B88
MRLRLADHTYMAPIENGLHIVTPAGPVTLTGPSIARWVEALVPQLDGRSGLDDITAGLPIAHAAMARQILTRLLDAGVVREVTAPPGDEPVAGPAEVAFVGAHTEGAGAAFARFRELKVAVAHEGQAGDPLAEAVAGALRTSGAGDVRVRAADALGDDDLWSLDVLLVIGELGAGGHERAARDGLAVGHVLRDGTDIWYVPVRGAKEDPLSPASLRARLRTAPRAPEPISDLHVEAAAAQVGRAVLRWATGTADPRHAGKVTRIGPDLTTSRHHCAPDPYELPATASTPEALLTRVVHLRFRPVEDGQAFSDAAVRAADELFGPFRFLPDDSAAQSPLHVSEAEVGDGVVRAVGFDYAETRIEAARAALTRYAAARVDPRRLVDGGGFALAYDLAAAATVRLPAHEAFPRPATGVGEGYGASWDEAVARGLCTHWTRDQELIEDVRGIPVTVDPGELDATGRRCFALLAELGELPEVREHGGRFGVTVLSFRRGGVEVARTAGTASAAWTRGLLGALYAVQVRVHAGRPRPPAEPRPSLPTAMWVDPGRSIDPDEVAAALATAGRQAVVIPLDHDPFVAAIAPLSVRVAIVKEGRQA